MIYEKMSLDFCKRDEQQLRFTTFCQYTGLRINPWGNSTSKNLEYLNSVCYVSVTKMSLVYYYTWEIGVSQRPVRNLCELRVVSLSKTLFTLTCSFRLRCKFCNRFVLQTTGDLSQQHFVLRSLAQSLVKRRRWAPLDAPKSVPTNYLPFSFDCRKFCLCNR